MRSFVAVAALLAIGFGAARNAQVQVRIEGYLEAPAERVRPIREVWVRIGRGEMRRFALTGIVVLSSGHVSGGDLLEQRVPIRPSFVFAGDEGLLEKIAMAAPNQLLKITGYTSFGSQWVMVTSVWRSAPITGPTPTPTLREKLLGF